MVPPVIWLYVVTFIGGILFAFLMMLGACYYGWRHREKYGALMVKQMFNSAGKKNAANLCRR